MPKTCHVDFHHDRPADDDTLLQDVCIPLAVRTPLCPLSLELQSMAFSHHSYATSAWRRVVAPGLHRDYTADYTTRHKSLPPDDCVPADIWNSQPKGYCSPHASGSEAWLLLLASNLDLRSITFHTPLNQDATFYLKLRAPKNDFSQPSQSECYVRHQTSSSEA